VLGQEDAVVGERERDLELLGELAHVLGEIVGEERAPRVGVERGLRGLGRRRAREEAADEEPQVLLPLAERYKTDNSTVWKCVSAVNGTATHSTSTKSSTKSTSVGGGWQELEIEATPTDSLSYTVVFSVDGEKLRDSTGAVIRHNLPFASATEMQVFVGAKLGAATNNDVLNVDYVYAAQRRAQLVP
jgi:hypothetical protein